MCLPCFPWTWTQYEDPLDSMPEQSAWVHDGHSWALERMQPVVGHQQGYVVAPQPVFAAQTVAAQPQQPIMINGQAYVPAIAAGQSFAGGGPPVFHQMHGGVAAHAGPMPIFAGNGSQVPDVSGVGRTPNEEMLRQVQFAFSNKLFEPQDFKPHDDDPSRFYYVREVDGNWTQRNRYTIDQMPCRWYVTDEGWFYAVRLPE